MRKRTLIFSSLVLLGTIVGSSCSKEEVVETAKTIAPVVIQAKMSAEIDNNAWSASVRNVTKTTNTISITGTSLDGKIIQITTLNTIAKTYSATLLDSSSKFTGLYKPTANITTDSIYTDSIYYATSGTVVLSTVDETNKTITGTFEMVLKRNYTTDDSIVVKNGVFSELKF